MSSPRRRSCTARCETRPSCTASCAAWRGWASSSSRSAGCLRAAGTSGHEPELAAAPDGVAPPFGVELAIDRLEVRLDRVDRDVELACDLLVGHHRRQVAQDRLLAVAQ